MGKRTANSKTSGEEKDFTGEVVRNIANNRERMRMKAISDAFKSLKCHLPWIPLDTKLSKADTLRLAVAYISHMDNLLKTTPSNDVTEQEIQAKVISQWPWRKLDKEKEKTAAQSCMQIQQDLPIQHMENQSFDTVQILMHEHQNNSAAIQEFSYSV